MLGDIVVNKKISWALIWPCLLALHMSVRADGSADGVITYVVRGAVTVGSAGLKNDELSESDEPSVVGGGASFTLLKNRWFAAFSMTQNVGEGEGTVPSHDSLFELMSGFELGTSDLARDAQTDYGQRFLDVTLGYRFHANWSALLSYRNTALELDYDRSTEKLGSDNTVTIRHRGNQELNQAGLLFGAAYIRNFNLGTLSLSMQLGQLGLDYKESNRLYASGALGSLNFTIPEENSYSKYTSAGDVKLVALGARWSGSLTEKTLYTLALDQTQTTLELDHFDSEYRWSLFQFSVGVGYVF